jgi:hypothetical protein
VARPLKHGEIKTERKLRVTDTGWEGARQIAGQRNCPGIAELLERIGRGDLQVVSPDPEPEPSYDERLKSAIADLVPRIPIKDRVAAVRVLNKLLARLQR